MEEKVRPARKATNMPERQVCQILLDTLRDQTIKAKALYYEIKLNKYYPKETTMYWLFLYQGVAIWLATRLYALRAK